MMHKRMTITLDADVYEGLNRLVGKRRISQFISDIVRPHVSDDALEEGYRAMAADAAENEAASEWMDALSNDTINVAR